MKIFELQYKCNVSQINASVDNFQAKDIVDCKNRLIIFDEERLLIELVLKCLKLLSYVFA